MATTSLPIRPGMDVYDVDQRVYIGTVVRVIRGGEKPGAGAGAVETGSSEQAVEGNPRLVHEEGATVSPTAYVGEQRLGEEMGPVPTVGLGNTGPIRQSAARHYATEPIYGLKGVVCFAVRPGRINLGFLTPSLWIPADAVRSISMDRIVLDVDKSEMPDGWRRAPSG